MLIFEQPLVPSTSITFVSQASIESGAIKSYGLRKRIEPVKNCRKISKSDMKYNDIMPKMKVDPERYVSIFCTCRQKMS
jgi:urease